MRNLTPYPLVVLAATLAASSAGAANEYKLGPDSQPRAGVPKGTVTKQTWATSKVFPGTVRDYSIYVPAQYKANKQACVMVFQDSGYASVPAVLDNLIHAREMPVTIGILINPGSVPAAQPGGSPRLDRSFEYDALSDRYARFLLDEIIPEVGKRYNLSKDPACRAIAGSSSGGIAAFTAAWERPDAFRRVFSAVGSYTDLRGGSAYPGLIRQTEPKPLRVFLQDGENDLNNYAGGWWIANQDMYSALEFAGYEVKHDWGDGGHDAKHASAILPDALRWLWKDYGKPIGVGASSKQPVMEILAPGEAWKLVGEGYKFTEGPAVNAAGEVFFTDIPNNRIHKVGANGKVSIFVADSGGANGLMFGADGKLYACQSGRKRIVAYDAAGAETVVADGLESNDLAVSASGNVYVTDPKNKQLWLVPRNGDKSFGDKRVIDTGIAFPNGVRLTPDQGFLYVADMQGRFVFSFQVQADGTLAHKQPFCRLHIPDTKLESGADGMTVDATGRLYVASHLGVQVCDVQGRVNGIIAKPTPKWLANVVFGGPQLDELYATASDQVWKRKTRVKGVLPFQVPTR